MRQFPWMWTLQCSPWSNMLILKPIKPALSERGDASLAISRATWQRIAPIRRSNLADSINLLADPIRSVPDMVSHLLDRATPLKRSPLISQSAPQGLESIINPLHSNILCRHVQPTLRKLKKKKNPRKKTYHPWLPAPLDYLKISVTNG